MRTTPKTTGNRRRKRVLFAALVLTGVVLGWYAVARLISPWTIIKSMTLAEAATAPPAGADGTLRVGCYNIAHGRGGRLGARNWAGGDRAAKLERLHQIASLLQDAELDLVVLNEVDFASFWSGHVDQARVIAAEAGYPYLLEQRNVDVAIPFCSIRSGNAVLSKYPLTEAELLDYPNGSRLAEIFIGGIKEGLLFTVELPDASRVRVVAVHLSHTSAAVRVASARMILDAQREATTPFIALGDFNSTPSGFPLSETDADGNNAIDLLLASKKLATLPLRLPADPSEFTFPAQHPDQIIDWIFVSAPWRLSDKHVLSSDLSDHLPVIAELTRQGEK